MGNATFIIDGLLGGTRPASRILERPPSTVQAWKKSGVIPARQQPDVLRKARAAGVPMTPADFFRTMDDSSAVPGMQAAAAA